MSIYWGAIASGSVYGGYPAGYANTPWPDDGVFGDGKGTATMNLFASHTGKAPTCYGLHQNFATWVVDPYNNARTHGAFVVLTVGVEGTTIAGINSGSQDAAIDAWAVQAKNFGQPFMIRPWHEMNGNWSPPYPWQTSAGVTAAQYVSAWQRFRSRCDAQGATNISWFWCPNAIEVGDPLPWYPGDAYVDWVGIDDYNKGGTSVAWQTLFDNSYNWWAAHTPSKPLALGEVGSLEYANSATKPAWITDFLSKLQTNYPGVKMFMWFNDNLGDVVAGTTGGFSTPLECTSPSVTVNTGTSLSSQAFASGISSSYFLANTVNSTTFPSGAKVPIPGATDTTAPTAPTSLAATANSSTQITLTWTAATDNVGVTQYRIERCQGVGCSNFVQIGTDTASPFVDTGLTASTSYNYRVRAADAAGNLGPYSNTSAAVTQSAGGYVKTFWVNDTTPALNATNLNHLTDELQLQASQIDPPIANSLPDWVNGSGAALSDATPLNEMERVTDLVAASVGLSYTPTAWSTGWTPARNAANLNHLEDAAYNARVALDANAGTPYLEAIFLNGKYSPSLSTVFAAYGTDSHIKNWGGLETTLPGNLGYDEVISDNAITPIAKDPAQRVSLRTTPVNPNGTGWVSRQEIRTTDPPWNPTSGSTYDKATSRPNSSLDVALTAGLVRWFSWDYFLPLNFGASNDTFNWCVGGAGNVFHTLMDLHLNGSQYEQVWNILEGVVGPLGNNNVYFRFHMGAHEGGSDPAPSDTEFVNVLQLTNSVGARVTASYNVWHKLVVGVKHNSDGGVGTSSGWVDIWHDGVNILPQHSRPTIFPNQTAEWQQMQNYKNHDGPLFGGATSSVIYYGGIRAGLTRTDVM